MSKSLPTRRQREVINLLADGLSCTSIGKRLGMSVKTVENQIFCASVRLGLRGKAQVLLVAWHFRQRISQLEAQLNYSKTFPRHD